MKYEPHEYQRYAINYIEEHPFAAVLLDMGLGKTSITPWPLLQTCCLTVSRCIRFWSSLRKYMWRVILGAQNFKKWDQFQTYR